MSGNIKAVKVCFKKQSKEKVTVAFETLLSREMMKNVNKNDNDLQKSSQGREMVDVIREYTEYSTIQGLIYLSLPKQTQGGKIFWSAVILGMLILGSYWSVEAYQVNKTSTCLFKLTTCQGGIFFICYHFISSLHIA